MTLFSPPKNIVSPNSTKGLVLLAKNWGESNKFFSKHGWTEAQARKNRQRLRGKHQDILMEYNPTAYEKLMQQNKLL